MDDSFSSVVTATSNNLTRLSTTVATTAQSLTTSSYGELVGTAAYQRTMRDIAKPLFKKRFFSSQARKAPVEHAHVALEHDVTRFKLLSEIPADLLVDLPPSRSRYSLYQGFEAARPADRALETADGGAQAIDACEVRKELASMEILEIDDQIARLQDMRKVVFDQVADLEKEERRLEKLPSEPKSSGSAASAGSSVSDRTGRTKTGGSGSGAATNSPARRASRRRKTQPTLQSFYAPGDRISNLQTGPDPVTMIDFDIPFGTAVAAAGSAVQVWDLGSGQCDAVLEGHTASIRCLQLDETMCATGSQDATLRLWDVTRGRDLAQFVGHMGSVTALHFDEDTLVSGSNDRTIRQWDVETQKCVQTLDVLWAGTTSTWSTSAAATHVSRLLAPLGYPTDDVTPAVGSLQNFDAAMAAGTADGAVRLWDLRAGSVMRTLNGHTAPVSCLQFDDVHLVSGSLDRTVRIWDLRTGAVVDSWSHDGPVLSLHFDAKRVFSATGEATVQVYDRQSGTHWSVGAGDTDNQAGAVTSVRQQRGYLVEGRMDGHIGVWAV